MYTHTHIYTYCVCVFTIKYSLLLLYIVYIFISSDLLWRSLMSHLTIAPLNLKDGRALSAASLLVHRALSAFLCWRWVTMCTYMTNTAAVLLYVASSLQSRAWLLLAINCTFCCPDGNHRGGWTTELIPTSLWPAVRRRNGCFNLSIP